MTNSPNPSPQLELTFSAIRCPRCGAELFSIETRDEQPIVLCVRIKCLKCSKRRHNPFFITYRLLLADAPTDNVECESKI